jgi:predicted nucleotidyltransferase
MKKSNEANNWKQLLNQELITIVGNLKKNYKPEKIILFGSISQKKVREWSDLDLVIIKKTNRRFYDRISDVSALIPHQVPVDVLVYTPQEFKQMAEENYFIKDEVLKRGKIIYVS